MNDPIIRLKNVRFQRDDKVILDDVSIDIATGSVVAIMGPSGVGKTTILRLISGALKPQGGSIEVNGKPISTLTRRQLYECRKDIGVLLRNQVGNQVRLTVRDADGSRDVMATPMGSERNLRYKMEKYGLV